jgi:hypothetical protein
MFSLKVHYPNNKLFPGRIQRLICVKNELSLKSLSAFLQIIKFLRLHPPQHPKQHHPHHNRPQHIFRLPGHQRAADLPR